jgi:hypothetical protein
MVFGLWISPKGCIVCLNQHKGMRAMTDADELFGAFGFEKLENGLWRFTRSFENDPDLEEGKDETAVVIIERTQDGSFIGHVPMADLQPMPPSEVPERSLAFASTDARDMIALAQNEIAMAYNLNTGLYLEEGFIDNDDAVFITMPFMSDPWSDYGVAATAKRDDKHIALVSPADVFTNYAGWRDEFCARLLAKPGAGL